MAESEEKQRRRQEILAAAFEVFAEKGFRGASMLAVARRAHCSKETLYSWFGGKERLIEEMVLWKSGGLQAALEQMIDTEPDDVAAVLNRFGILLMTTFVSSPAMLLNRIAIGEAGQAPELGRIMIDKGRNRILPRFQQYLLAMRDKDLLTFDDVDRASDLFVGVLQGDLRIRVLMGTEPAPDQATIQARAAWATDCFMGLFGTRRT
ncbi:TetR/AcrR family transcriptional regulator [Magnetospira sp. QH-2]|uniref:TetR/AcrR family transcriptional regulator n=1 Tax=Magnetospira sp. (strain QH-2) TaxID=1288970 RepID=UPI0003E810C0|nr:TetR/AcrR family transcriptional regulator [Magnetospira sp. QH-2]CCQ74873.1 putative transcriptional regulator, TetR family [Magnetospira sp. QH-2]